MIVAEIITCLDYANMIIPEASIEGAKTSDMETRASFLPCGFHFLTEFTRRIYQAGGKRPCLSIPGRTFRFLNNRSSISPP